MRFIVRMKTIPTILLLVFISASAHSQPRALTPADILRVATVGDAQISPNGEWVV